MPMRIVTIILNIGRYSRTIILLDSCFRKHEGDMNGILAFESKQFITSPSSFFKFDLIFEAYLWDFGILLPVI